MLQDILISSLSESTILVSICSAWTNVPTRVNLFTNNSTDLGNSSNLGAAVSTVAVEPEVAPVIFLLFNKLWSKLLYITLISALLLGADKKNNFFSSFLVKKPEVKVVPSTTKVISFGVTACASLNSFVVPSPV